MVNSLDKTKLTSLRKQVNKKDKYSGFKGAAPASITYSLFSISNSPLVLHPWEHAGLTCALYQDRHT